MTLFLENVAQLFPLVVGRIDTGRVVSTATRRDGSWVVEIRIVPDVRDGDHSRVQEDDRVVRGVLNGPMPRGGVTGRGRQISLSRSIPCSHGTTATPTWMSLFIPSKLSPTVSLSKYVYCLTSNPESLAIGVWLPHEGAGR